MVPPPSAVMQLSMHTPAQSMLRRPAASAAVIACAAIAPSDSQYSTKSLAGRLHITIRSSPYVVEPCGFRRAPSTGIATVLRNIHRCRKLSSAKLEELDHGLPTH